jgi:hypothetical protein
MLESDSKVIRELCWQKQIVHVPVDPTATGADAGASANAGANGAPKAGSPTVSEGSTTAESANATASSTATPAANPTPAETTVESEPLAVILVNAMFHLLFLPDFTIEDPHIDFNVGDINSKEFKSALMWAPGVGSTEKSVVTSSEFDDNRIEILRMMIAAFRCVVH